jgi:hypothetical protein
MTRFRVVVVHGESRSLFHVADAGAPDAEQPRILRTYHSRQPADDAVAVLNRRYADWPVATKEIR